MRTKSRCTSARSRLLRFVAPFALTQIATATCSFNVPAASATTLARMDLPSLVQAAEIVVDARCVGQQVRAERGSIWTFAEFDVVETLAGSVRYSRVTVRLPGGQIGHLRESVDGVPRFYLSERVVLFLERTSAGDYGITGWTQGTFRVTRGAAGTEDTATQDSSGFAVFDARSRKFETAGIVRMPMSEFRARIASAARSNARRPQ